VTEEEKRVEVVERLARSGKDGGLDGEDEKEPDEDSSGEGLESVVDAIERRLGEAQGEEKADCSESERKGRLEGDGEAVSTALLNQAGDEADMVSLSYLNTAGFKMRGCG